MASMNHSVPSESPSVPTPRSNQIKRVALLCTRLEGGIGRNIIRLARSFTSWGIDVEVWADDCRSDFPGELPEGVRLRHIRSSHGVTGVFFLYRLIKGFSPDVIVTPTERQTRISRRACILSRDKPFLVACVHNLYSKQYQSLPEKKIRKRKKHLAAVYPKIDAVISVSRAVATDFEKYIGKSLANMSVVYNPVVGSSELSSGKDEITLPDCYGRIPVVVTVGSIVPQKNHLFLIECFDRLRAMRECALVIVGAGGDMDKIQQRVSKSPYRSEIYLVGHQPNPYPYISQAKLFAFTSDYEGFGNVVVESLLLGTPVVSTDSGGPKEILIDADCGEIVGLGDRDSFVFAMNKWLDKQVDKNKLVQFAADNFSTDKIASQYLSLFNSVFSARKLYK